jgi:transcription factor SFP1
MQGTSPFGGVAQSPSFHSSSYLPKLEANFMRDFTCCGQILPNLHDLLQHYEEAHTQPSPNTSRTNNSFNQFSQFGMPGPSSMGASRGTPGAPGQMPGQPSGTQFGRQHNPSASGMQMLGMAQNINGGVGQMNAGLGTHDEMDAVGDMELDDPVGTMELDDSQKMHQTRQLLGQQQRPQLNMNTSGLTQGLRTSQPTTPAAASFGLQNNPTVSSVNTPTLTTHPDDNDMEADFGGMEMGDGTDVNNLNMGNNGDGTNNGLFIDEPGKHLLSSNGGTFTPTNKTIQQQLAQLGLAPGQNQVTDPEAQKELLARLHSMMMPEEHKPFKCPVIGCEKAYKNQNGLK